MTEQAWTDQALHSAEGDTLGRLAYARRAADLIHATHSFESSAVFGLSGPWGSGKTSLVNMIVNELEQAHPEWAVARFTPWATSDITGLLGEFYASLADVLPKKKGQQVRRALAATASVAAPAANLIPIAGGVAVEGVRAIGEALAKSPSWDAAFKKASGELKELEKPILVVVDDIDRLHAEELMALLKVVRLLGRFDGVQYLLAYDDETLHRSMTASNAVSPHDGTAERFMEKIVQYPLFVPPLLRHQQLSRLNAGLASVSRTDADDGGGGQSRLSGLVECFVATLTTPRAIDRYIAQLRHHIPLLPPEEVDDEDVQLLTLVRVSFPALFNAIPRFRNELLTGHTDVIKRDSRQFEYERFDIDPMLAVVPSAAREVARQLLTSLFPKVHNERQLVAYASHRRQSLQNEEYFDRYFAMGILDHDVSDATVATAVQAAQTGDPAPLVGLLVVNSADIRSLALSKGLRSPNQPPTDVGRLRLAEALVLVSSQLPADDTGPFGDQDSLLGWIADLLVKLDGLTPPGEVLAVIAALTDTTMRIRAWKKVQSKAEDAHRADPPTWLSEATARLVRTSLDEFLAHLKQGDDAATSVGVGYQVHFLLRHDPERLRAEIAGVLGSKEADLSVLASRLVSASTITGIKPDWKLSTDFDQETFDKIAPPGDDPWYEASVEDVDRHDLTWANRRRFVAGRVSPPPGRPAAPAEDDAGRPDEGLSNVDSSVGRQ